jgi:nucleoside-diphosphate-sugar epimerase
LSDEPRQRSLRKSNLGFAAVTGTSGFVGQHLTRHLIDADVQVLGFSRRATVSQDPQNIKTIIGDLGTLHPEGIASSCNAVDIFYHLAGRAHRPDELEDDSCSELFRNDNVQATERAYQIAQGLGARRFVYISSIKVLGDVSISPLSPNDTLQPTDSYARSKCEAEELLERMQRHSTVAVTVVRPPLIYGPNVGGNFERLLGLAYSGVPLPLSSARAPRSMVSIRNLCALLVDCIPSDDAPFRVLHVRDANDVNVEQLLTNMSHIMRKNSRLFFVPERILRVLASWIRRSTQFSRLFDPMQVDDSETRKLFAWTPPQSSDAALKETVECWISQR